MRHGPSVRTAPGCPWRDSGPGGGGGGAGPAGAGAGRGGAGTAAPDHAPSSARTRARMRLPLGGSHVRGEVGVRLRPSHVALHARARAVLATLPRSPPLLTAARGRPGPPVHIPILLPAQQRGERMPAPGPLYALRWECSAPLPAPRHPAPPGASCILFIFPIKFQLRRGHQSLRPLPGAQLGAPAGTEAGGRSWPLAPVLSPEWLHFTDAKLRPWEADSPPGGEADLEMSHG
jgi:hypothetical protein